MRRTAIVVVAIAVTTVLPMTAAVATPPVGDIKYTDLAREQTLETAAVPITRDSTLVTGLYSIAPGGQSGWHRLPGTMALAVTKGKLMVQGGEGCATRDYATGQAAVVPAGVYQVHNPGSEPLEFFGLFFEQTAGAPKPLSDGPTVGAPANCSGVKAAGAPAGVALTSPAAGAFVTDFYGHGATLDIQGGLDMFATRYEIAPGTSTGWISHRPNVNIMEQGTLSYVEERNGRCYEAEAYSAGSAFYHPAHRHMALNKGKEPVFLTAVFFNLPHEKPLPGIGNQIQAVDFTQTPPKDCMRLM